jgi:hypothetical protein
LFQTLQIDLLFDPIPTSPHQVCTCVGYNIKHNIKQDKIK